MGEAPAFFVDDLQNACGLTSNCCQTATVIGTKRYLIGKTDGESKISIDVRIFDEIQGEWVIPAVLGTKPEPCKGHSAVPLNGDRILIIRKGSLPANSIWFLEVDSKYVRDQKEVLGTEVVAWSKGVIGDTEKPIVISGPSGVGKGTLISMLMKEFPSMFGFSVSHTTRAPRVMEQNGVHYHFTERSVMEKDIKDGKFLEFASVHGNLYGSSIEAVEAVADVGKKCILDIDVQGARSVKDSSLEATFIFICPPSMEVLEKRLRSRGTEAEEQVLKRLQNAEAEIDQGTSSGIFDHIIYNDNLDECYQNLKKLLGLDGTTAPSHRPCKASLKSAKEVDLPSEHTVSKANNKILITCGVPGSENASKNLIVSSLKGGAPGRTRGLDIFAVGSSSDCLDETIQLS